MFFESSETYQWLLLVVAIVTVLLPILGNRFSIPTFMVFGRWTRWFLFGALFAYFLKTFEISFRPEWVHFITGLAVWFVLETGYNWIAIKALSRSELPLFPDFYENIDGDEWPADDRFIELKDWLRAEKYNRLKALKAELFVGTYLRASIYESQDGLTRIQILFLPKRKGGATACYTISTHASSGERLITDNLFLPYGGYYPESWNICRKPLIGSLRHLLRLHQRRLLASKLEPVLVEEDALTELNEQQRILERLNIETGFLVPRPRQEEEGKISYEGRYRLWKEMWMLAYLGKSVA
ncbi:hypothetical protein QEH59_16530 [Coraliomargarita sp. SDUM461004]|uniref:Uncharacterized protein n=1 Tax=Thalassobacterium sedimentorum TaxID=3041258 RepID=A0ABU1AMM5_9BACT|nr:hypothetical protein [Coraliomargarita sp. SDUM461004]MDQ8196044.1 hypothetical protein [Coraliomargarita sp. SDUM461004]